MDQAKMREKVMSVASEEDGINLLFLLDGTAAVQLLDDHNGEGRGAGPNYGQFGEGRRPTKSTTITGGKEEEEAEAARKMTPSGKEWE
jgi:hypothetical protein